MDKKIIAFGEYVAKCCNYHNDKFYANSCWEKKGKEIIGPMTMEHSTMQSVYEFWDIVIWDGE